MGMIWKRWLEWLETSKGLYNNISLKRAFINDVTHLGDWIGQFVTCDMWQGLMIEGGSKREFKTWVIHAIRLQRRSKHKIRLLFGWFKCVSLLNVHY